MFCFYQPKCSWISLKLKTNQLAMGIIKPKILQIFRPTVKTSKQTHHWSDNNYLKITFNYFPKITKKRSKLQKHCEKNKQREFAKSAYTEKRKKLYIFIYDYRLRNHKAQMIFRLNLSFLEKRKAETNVKKSKKKKNLKESSKAFKVLEILYKSIIQPCVLSEGMKNSIKFIWC